MNVETTTYNCERLLTIPQLSEKMGVPAGTIRDWVHTRYVPFVKLGRRIFFDLTVINDWIAEKAHAGRLHRKMV